MLKALELHGFKSFADKTRFEFPSGITVVVGPNGSGKSNVVDAIKWVLGEQSAKSLRGKEMADVIYKGSGTEARRPMNTAEATIVFDNQDGRLPAETPEVRVTRRVYRSGEGEYLINGQPCRLRDVKDLFRGTGVGADAYSIIEQGKVDTLLQSSVKERRAIFEEAAGITRFKSKKVEAQRRMERVEQNLLRLSDIVDEVETRLRSIRSQAGKARRYREYTERLKELRTQVGLVDWRRLTEELESLEAELAEVGETARTKAQEADEFENRSLELVGELEQLEATVREFDHQQSQLRERAATLKSNSAHQQQRAAEQEALAARHRARLSAMTIRAGDLHTQHREVVDSLSEARQTHQQASDEVARLAAELATIEQQLETLRQSGQNERHEQLERTKLTTRLAEQIRSAEERRQHAHEAAQRHQSRVDDLNRSLKSHVERRTDLEARERDLAAQAARRAEERQALEANLENLRRQLDQRQEELSQEQSKLTGHRQRIEVLEDLEKRQEGLGIGVRNVLEGRQRDPGGPLGDVLGMVADLLQVQVEMAPLIELALGERAQHLVVRGTRLLELVQSGQLHFAGRVALVPLEGEHLQAADEQIKLEGRPGVIGRADRFVRGDSQVAGVVEHFLADTWVVESLAHALELRERTGDEVRYITASGEMLEADGTLKVGPRSHSTGIISRRSQLRMLTAQVTQLEREVKELGETVVSQQQAIAERQKELKQLIQKHTADSDRLAEHRAELRAASELCQQYTGQLESAQADLAATRGQYDAADTVLESARANVKQAQEELAELATRIRDVEEQIAELVSRRAEHQKLSTAAEVEMARRVQRLDALEAQLAQLEADQRERERNFSEARSQLADALEERRLAELKVLACSSELAELSIEQETLARQAQAQLDERQALTQRRAELARQAQARRVEERKADEKHHQLDMQASDIRHQRTTMAERLREDYGIELAELEREPSEEELEQRDAVEEEITDLRRKISNIGAVNMEALNELDDLEERYTILSTQYQDLVAAKEALEKIIQRINADSRRMFSETLEAIRSNFQTLFRKVFGGGHADIVLEEGADVLEAGVEILATPPGKHSLGISLLSGGERALTAVTLLLAIFEFRPSPFCVLDEVDGPLDEANIGRFVDVLRSFLSWTRFVVVTHSKKTMTAAHTLYGVTMQESGVSKRVSVKFEDVSEDGAISRQAIDREESEQGSDGRGAA